MSGNYIIYKAYGANGALLYVGKSVNFISRIGQHVRGSDWFNDVSEFKLVRCKNKKDMDDFEKITISISKPKFNIQFANNDNGVPKNRRACMRAKNLISGSIFKAHVRNSLRTSNNVPFKAIAIALFGKLDDPSKYKAKLGLCHKMNLPLSPLDYYNLVDDIKRAKNE